MLELVSGLLTAGEAIKKAMDAGRKMQHADVQMALAEALSSLAEARFQVVNLMEQKAALERELAAEKAGDNTPILQNGDRYYFNHPKHGQIGPYCTVCWDTTGKRVILREQDHNGNFDWWCLVCDHGAGKRGHSGPPYR